jgi:hypothetical protein
MTADQIAALLWKAVAVFGGVSVISVAISGFLAKFLADRSIERHKATLVQETERLKAELGKDAETHKWKLKKNELLFEKEYAAAIAFFELRRKYEPSRKHPDMDWSEVQEYVIESFTDAEIRIAKFIAEHGPVLSTDSRKLLDECQSLASSHQFASHGYDDHKEAEQAADKFLELLREIEGKFTSEIRS